MPIHNFKYCPNCAHEGLLWESEKNFKCKNCLFTYYHNQAAAVCIIINFENKILLTKRKKDPAKGYLDLPGGFVEPNETAVDSAIRELKEEVNLNLNAYELAYFDTSYNDYLYKNVLYKTLDIAFKAKITDKKEISIGDKKEIEAIFWVYPKEIDFKKIGFFSIKNIFK